MHPPTPESIAETVRLIISLGAAFAGAAVALVASRSFPKRNR